jgi:hypothetical protein
MTQIPHITFAVAADPVAWTLMLVVGGTVLIAPIANALALVSLWRRRP